MALINFLRPLLIIFCTFNTKFGVLIVLGPLACILHFVASIGCLSVASSSFQTLLMKDHATFRKRATLYHYVVFLRQ